MTDLHTQTQDLIAASERTRKLCFRIMVGTVIGACVIFFGGMAGAVYLANTNRLALLREIGSIVGACGIVIGVAFIGYLLSRPPFSSGEWRDAIKNLRDSLLHSSQR